MEKKSSKKKFDLTTDMIKVESPASNELDSLLKIQFKGNKKKKVKLTLTGEEEFLKELKSWCIKKDMTVSDALVKAFPLLKKEFGY